MGTASFVFDLSSANAAFPQIAPRELILAVLAGVPPQPAWEGCEVYQGPAPDGSPPGTVCIGLRGPAADALQEAVVTAMERFGVSVPQIWEGGPEPSAMIAVVRGGRWERA
jgi:hypothetical protein